MYIHSTHVSTSFDARQLVVMVYEVLCRRSSAPSWRGFAWQFGLSMLCLLFVRGQLSFMRRLPALWIVQKAALPVHHPTRRGCCCLLFACRNGRREVLGCSLLPAHLLLVPSLPSFWCSSLLISSSLLPSHVAPPRARQPPPISISTICGCPALLIGQIHITASGTHPDPP